MPIKKKTREGQALHKASLECESVLVDRVTRHQKRLKRTHDRLARAGLDPNVNQLIQKLVKEAPTSPFEYILYHDDVSHQKLNTKLDGSGWPEDINGWLLSLARASCRGDSSDHRKTPSSFRQVNLHHCSMLSDRTLTLSIPYFSTSLTNLNISHCFRLTDTSLDCIRKHASKLKSVNISSCTHFTSHGISQLWLGCRRLEFLRARHCPGISDAVCQTIASSGSSLEDRENGLTLKLLKLLDFTGCRNITDAGVGLLIDSASIQVCTLELAGCPRLSASAFFGFGNSVALANSLVQLNLGGLALDDSGLSWLAASKSTTLTRLSLAKCSGITNFGLSLLAVFVHLEVLDLSHCQELSNDGLQTFLHQLATLACEEEEDLEEETTTTNLAEIHIKSCLNLGDSALVAIARYCPKLSQLDIRGCPHVSDSGLVAVAKYCAHLSHVWASGCGSLTFYGQPQLSDVSIVTLAKCCRTLECLDVAGCVGISDVGLSECFSKCTKLVTVNVSGTAISDVSLVLGATHCPALRSVTLNKCRHISNVGIEALCQGLSDTLKHLSLAYCPGITDVALAHFGAYSVTNLESLNLAGNERISNVGLIHFCESVPTCRVLNVSACPVLTPDVLPKHVLKLLPFATMGEPSTSKSKSTYSMVTQAHPTGTIEYLELLLDQFYHALVLQSHYRSWKLRKDTLETLLRRRISRERRAAKKIQTLVRGFLDWKRFVHLLELGQNMRMILRIQSLYRGEVVRKWFVQIRLERLAAIQKIQRAYGRHYDRRAGAALTIERTYRGYLGRCIHWQLVHEIQLEAAWVIMVFYRHKMLRYNVKQRSLAYVRNIRRVQNQIRVFLMRVHFQEYLAFHRIRILRLQSWMRQVLAKAFVHHRRITYHTAVLKIQKIFRGYVTRCWIAELHLIRHTSAVKIQTCLRRHQAQMHYRHSRIFIVHLQHWFRFTLCRLKLIEIHEGLRNLHHFVNARTIQRLYRGWKGRRRAILFQKIQHSRRRVQTRGVHVSRCHLRFLQVGAALVIQRQFVRRRILPQTRLRKWIRLQRQVASACIVKSVRLWFAENQRRNQRRVIQFSAGEIQRVYRGMCARVVAKDLKDLERRHECATSIQAQVRRFLAQILVEEKRDVENQAAGQIQNCFRRSRMRFRFRLRIAQRVLELKQTYMTSVRGKMENKLHPIEDKMARIRLRHEVELIEHLKDEWSRRRHALRQAQIPLRRQYRDSLRLNDDVIRDKFRTERKLVGVTENAYTTKLELAHDRKRQVELTLELKSLHFRMMEFKHVMREAIETKRVMSPEEFWNCSNQVGLFQDLDLVASSSNNNNQSDVG